MNDYLKNIAIAVQWIKSGHVVAYPTESVYGLGCDPENLSAVRKILEIKQRSASKGLILVAADLNQITRYIKKLSNNDIAKINTASAKAITWLIPANNNISSLLTGKHNQLEKKIAIRISQHPIIKALCLQLGHPIVSTSANISGQAMCRTADEVSAQLKTGIDYIIDQPCGNNSCPSEIWDLISGVQIR